MNIFYWCPFLSKVATVQAVINSAISLKKYSKNKISPHIINAIGEWDDLQNLINENNIGLIKLTKSKSIYKSLPRYSYLKSRLSYIFIGLYTSINLFKFLKARNQGDIFVIHLISSLPLLLILLFNFKCKFILRISGYPKLNFFRRLLWKACKKELSIILCPTEDTKNDLIEKKIFKKEMFHILYDPVIEVKKISSLKKKSIKKNLVGKKFILNIGRLTDQKNQKMLIEGFINLLKFDPNLYLVILGEGELESNLKKFVLKMNIENKVYFLGHVENVYNYLQNAKCFILTSKWEDPGFVLIEAAFLKQTIISADCPNGPKEILQNGSGGYLFKSDDVGDLVNKYKQFDNDTDNNIKNKKLKTLKISKNYTCFNHYVLFNKILKLI